MGISSPFTVCSVPWPTQAQCDDCPATLFDSVSTMKMIQANAPLNSLNEPHLRSECVATRQYAYLVQQSSEIVNLSNYVLKNLFEDDAEQWFTLHQPRNGHVDTDVKDAIKVEAQLQLERRRTFNAIMLCQIYDAFDLYCVRLRKVASAGGDSRRGCTSNLDYNREAFRRKGWAFLSDERDYQTAVMIKDSRNLITHNHGLVPERFHEDHPSLSDGVNTVLRIYSEELEEHMTFLTRTCFRLDEQAAKSLSLKRKPIKDWSGPASGDQEDDDE